MSQGNKIKREEAIRKANILIDICKSFIEKYELVGSIRRQKEEVGDIDVLIIPKDPGKIYKLIKDFGIEIHGGQCLANFIFLGTKFNLVFTNEKSWGASLLHTTGSSQHNISLRILAKKRNWKLNRYGLIDLKTGKIIASKTEEEIYSKLGKRWKNPKDR